MSRINRFRIIMLQIMLTGGIFLILGCGQMTAATQQIKATVSPMETQQNPTQSMEGNMSQMTPSLPADAGLQNLIDKAIADLASRLSIPEVEITLLEATSVVWPDSSLGCPQPGMAYIQVPEDGLLIRLQAGEQTYEYHSGGVRDPFLCVKTGKDPNPPPQIDIFNLTPPEPKSTPDPSPAPDNSIPPAEDQ